jgi:tRNA G46 methylase TrmB
MVRGVPDARIDRTYILYPCPWPKTAHRRNRWYLHPIMPHLVRTLKPGGRLVWASDQEFYIDEARFVCESRYGLEVLAHGAISPNPYNDLEAFPGGRTKFERTFLEGGQPCYELVVRKP